MACHQADAAQQAAWRSSGRRSSCPQWHLLGVAFGAPWRDLPEAFGPCTTCYNRFVRWRRAGVQMHLLPPMMPAVPMIGTSIVRVHRHAQEPRARQFEFCKPHQHGYPVQALCPKINLFLIFGIYGLTLAVPLPMRGAYASSRTWCGMRWTGMGREMSGTLPDGEDVWSWRPDAGAKLATMLTHRADDGGKRALVHRGERL